MAWINAARDEAAWVADGTAQAPTFSASTITRWRWAKGCPARCVYFISQSIYDHA
jgi:hypothetical protein